MYTHVQHMMMNLEHKCMSCICQRDQFGITSGDIAEWRLRECGKTVHAEIAQNAMRAPTILAVQSTENMQQSRHIVICVRAFLQNEVSKKPEVTDHSLRLDLQNLLYTLQASTSLSS